jgi:hypothetical protein
VKICLVAPRIVTSCAEGRWLMGVGDGVVAHPPLVPLPLCRSLLLAPAPSCSG